MTRRLKAVVVVSGVVYGPGHVTDVPPEVAARIRNPAVWTDDAPADEPETPPAPAAPGHSGQIIPAEPAGPGGLNPHQAPDPSTASSAVPPADGTPAGSLAGKHETGNAPGQPLAEPPRSGKGSSENAWRAYAEQQGVDVEGLERGEIIAKLRDADVIR